MEYPMAKSGIKGTDLCFSSEDFTASLGMETVDKIVITELPALSVGHLLLDNRYVEEGQVISGNKLNRLKFVPYGTNETQAVFRFCVGEDPFGAAYRCDLYTLDTVNTAPTVSASDSIFVNSAGEAAAYSGIVHHGIIPASDAEGDALRFEILRNPAHGTLQLVDSVRGYYEYTADADYTGPDSFTVRVTDRYGNRSAETKLSLRVKAPEDGEVFADMEGHPASAAVISCVRSGVLDAPEADECFYPDEAVSRAEFLDLAMRAAGYDGFYAARTHFADDAEIPSELRGCILAAEALGIVNGIDAEGTKMFYPNHKITRSEAAVIVSRLTGIAEGAVEVFADDAVPTWASGAMAGLAKAGVLRYTNGTLGAYEPLTRADAATLAAAIMGMRK